MENNKCATLLLLLSSLIQRKKTCDMCCAIFLVLKLNAPDVANFISLKSLDIIIFTLPWFITCSQVREVHHFLATSFPDPF